MYQFYGRAYSVLTKEHDNSKVWFIREFATKLNVDELKYLFSEFCFNIYLDGKLKLSYADFELYFNKTRHNQAILLDNFINDITINSNLMCYDSGYYRFLHRSFIEYFVAYYIYKSNNNYHYKLLKNILNSNFSLKAIKIINMLVDMLNNEFEKFIILPYLTEFLNKYSNNYIKFLQDIYPIIEYSHGECTSGYSTTNTNKLYDFIIHKYKIHKTIDDDKLPFNSNFVKRKYVYSFDIETYNALIDADFALKKEFNYIVSLYKMLSDNYA